MKQSHDSFMAEVSPNDGHKKNVIEINHNYVGLGYATIRNQFRYYEEYIDRYIDVNIDKSIVHKNENISISFRPINNNMHPYAVIVYREPPLKEMTKKEINSRSSYHDFSNEVSYTLWPWDLNKSDASGYTNLKFSFEKNGLYYVDIYLDDQEYKKNSRVNTNGKLRSSGIVFFVK